MKIFNVHQIREADQYTIENEPITSLELMERAAGRIAGWVAGKFAPRHKVAVCCGTGNNGGDGLAVARLLLERGYAVDVFIVGGDKEGSPDFEANKQRLSDRHALRNINDQNDMPDWDAYQLLIDAIFGSGLSRPVEGLYGKVIEGINSADTTVIAVDMPSGLFADQSSLGNIILRADHTLTFQLPKLALLMPENAEYVGEWETLDIGLSAEYIQGAESPYTYLSEDLTRKILRKREKFSNKGDYGRAMIVAGSYGKMGAAVLCGRAALRSGIGLLTMYVPICGYEIIQINIPEAMVMTDESARHISSAPESEKMDALGIGPGLGMDQETLYALIEAVRIVKKPVVLDADALNLIASHHELKRLLPANSVLTPHPKEFERLAGSWENDFERLEKQKELAREINCIILLKGAHTSVALPDGRVFFNSTGNPGMATGGSGDVLTGIITALVAQQYDPGDATLLGVYVHGLAGDIASREYSDISMISGDIITKLPSAFKSLE